MTERDERHLLTGAYALNALEKSDRAEFERYLAESENARTEVTEMQETAALLGLSSKPVAPSPALKSNLMALISTTPQLRAETAGPSATPTLVPVPASNLVSASTRNPSPEDQRNIRSLADGTSTSAQSRAEARWYRKPLNALVAAAAAAALIAGGVAIGQASTDNSYELAQANSFAQLTAAEDLQQSVSKVNGGGTAKLLWSDDLQQSAMVMNDLPDLGDDRVYQLWYIDEAGAVSAGTIAAADSGMSWRVLEGVKTNGAAVGLTVEPKGGSEEPTTTPIVVIEDA